jgi:alcohol dehydrogenase
MAFRVPTHVELEAGCFARLGERVAEERAADGGAGGVALVADRGLAAAGWTERAQQLLRRAGAEPRFTFEEVEANPRAATVEALGERLRREAVSLVVGLGGGSVLDAAKAAAVLATNGGAVADYEGVARYRRPPLPVVAVPTTCGTGSEVTWVAVISLPERRLKISVKGEAMFPRRALVDADLLATLPPPLVAATGLDALTHALEAATGRRANPASDALAARAVALLLRFLRRAAADPAGDGEARAAVMTASTLAGMAFGNADVGAVHCLSESLGGLFDVPHGLANGLLLAPVLRSHGAAVTAPLADLTVALPGGDGGGDNDAKAERLLSAVEQLVADLDLPPFSSLAIPRQELAEVASRAVANGSNTSNPRSMGEAEYLAVLEPLVG